MALAVKSQYFGAEASFFTNNLNKYFQASWNQIKYAIMMFQSVHFVYYNIIEQSKNSRAAGAKKFFGACGAPKRRFSPRIWMLALWSFFVIASATATLRQLPPRKTGKNSVFLDQNGQNGPPWDWTMFGSVPVRNSEVKKCPVRWCSGLTGNADFFAHFSSLFLLKLAIFCHFIFRSLF